MYRFLSSALTAAVVSAVPMVAQTPPAPANSPLTVRGCVEPMQRDGSLAPKAGATATPENATMEANNPDLLNAYMLLDAAPANAAAVNSETKPANPTQYALRGHESELAKLHGKRVEIVGTVMPKVGTGKAASAADGMQHIRVASVKAIAGECSAVKK